VKGGAKGAVGGAALVGSGRAMYRSGGVASDIRHARDASVKADARLDRVREKVENSSSMHYTEKARRHSRAIHRARRAGDKAWKIEEGADASVNRAAKGGLKAGAIAGGALGAGIGGIRGAFREGRKAWKEHASKA